MNIRSAFSKANLKVRSLNLKNRVFSGAKQNNGKFAFDVSVFFSFLVLTILTFTGLHIFREESYADTDIAAIITQNGYYINTTSDSLNGSINMNVNATASGTMAIAKDTLNIKSNVPDGYNVYVAMKRDEACTDNCNALKKDGSTANIPATTGTFSNPTTLSTNTWGYAIEKNQTGAPANNFDTTYNTSVPDGSNVFAALPAKGNDQLIQTINTPNSVDGIDANIYYGINVNTAKESGIYRGEITYSIVAKNASGVAEIASVSPDSTDKLEGGEMLTISTNYTFSPENAGNVNIFINSLTESKPCTNVAKTIVNGALQFTCIAPAYDTGKYDVRVLIPNYSKDITLTRALNYYVDSADSKNLRNAVKTGFNSGTLESTVDSSYYAGDTLPLSDLVDVYNQDFDDTKTGEQNTADSGITINDDGSVSIAPGYHSGQTVPSSSLGGGSGGTLTGILTVDGRSHISYGWVNAGCNGRVCGGTNAIADWSMAITIVNNEVSSVRVVGGTTGPVRTTGAPTTDNQRAAQVYASIRSATWTPGVNSSTSGTVRVNGTSSGQYGWMNAGCYDICGAYNISLSWVMSITIANNAVSATSTSPSSSSLILGGDTSDNNTVGKISVSIGSASFTPN